ncbi:DNA methyltransferase [Enterococcus sp. AZ101]|uniref:DNA methyltransferase n=1 Tax=Enterococcus sp. AZ101 TaxID=2774742 RepID=UPI003D2778A7
MKCDRGECTVKIEPKIFDELKTVLSSFGDKYFVGEELNRSKLSEDLRNYEEALLEKLFQIDFIKQHFIKEVAGQNLFQIEQLEEAILYNDYWDTSYTKYENRIGLASNGKFLEDSQDVVLDFPFKDGVLTASMTKEDNEDGYDDAFLNEVIEKDEIDRLFDKKIFVNSKRYDGNGESAVTDFNEDKDNLIIKGNNLLSLHAIKEKYAGKVKVIYIDPPYNTGSDSFAYNDKFNQSTWLTFMKNRLEIAREMLTEDGSIFVQIDSFQESYLKVLMDSIFGRENFRNKITWKRRGGSANPSNQLNNVAEWILWYVKDNTQMDYSPVYSLNDDNTQKYIKERFVNIDENGRKYMKSPIQSPNYRENLIYDYKGYKTPKKGYSVSRNVMEKWDKEGRLAFPDSKEKNINRKIFLDEYKGQPINSLWTDIYVINPMSNERVDFSSGQKPEALIKRIINMVSQEDELVLDFFMGSATTQAVAMKMNRRFIGIEQMDYINEVSVPRLQKVIAGEQGGISKEVNWQGGSSFVYTELMSKNMGYLQDIIHSKTLDELKVVYHRMLEGTDSMEPADISFRADLNKIDWMEGFVENKRLLIKLLDKNGLYYNYSEIDDANVRELISDKDYLFNKQFYEGGE